MGTCGLFLKRKLKNPLTIFAVFVLIITMCVSCATTTDEEVSENGAIKENDDEALIEEQEEERRQKEKTQDQDLIEVSEELIKVESKTEKGFHWDYYLFIPVLSIPEESSLPLLVTPNNTGKGHENIQVHDDAARSDASQTWKNQIARRLEVPQLVPVFPRELGKYYTHQLSRDVMLIEDGNLQRIDLQLIAMIEDARELLGEKGVTMKEKILLKGFSASGTFSIRFAILHPHLVRAVAAGGVNGLTTFPTEKWEGKKLRYPIGIADLEEITGIRFDLDEYREIDQYIYMGSLDDNDTVWDGAPYYSGEDIKLIRDITSVDVQERWLISQQIYKDLGIPVQFETYEGVGHSVTHDMIKDVVSFFRDEVEVNEP